MLAENSRADATRERLSRRPHDDPTMQQWGGKKWLTGHAEHESVSHRRQQSLGGRRGVPRWLEHTG